MSLPISMLPGMCLTCLDLGFRGLDKEHKLLMLAGVAATCWSIWRCRNDLVFDRKSVNSPLQVIHSIIHWLRTWNVLLKPGLQELVIATYRCLEEVLLAYFSQAHEW
jgi:hypothetical protein